MKPHETFSNRTDALALKLGINVQDLPPKIGIGRASLFCYRTGARPISDKTWLKLARAESDAGISLPFVDTINAVGVDAFMHSLGGIKEISANGDLEAQMRVLLGIEGDAYMVHNHWAFLELDLQSFFESIRKNKNAAPIFAAEITNLQRKIKSFSYQFYEYFDQVLPQNPDTSP